MTRNCPNCGDTRSTVALALRAPQFVNETYAPDYQAILGLRGDESFSIMECARCGFRYVRDVPEFLPALYERAIRTPPLERGWFAHQLELAGALLAATSGRILDYGCGPGHLVRALQGAGIDCVGYDPHVPPFAQRPSGQFDGAIMSDVLEHSPDPRGMLKDVRSLLNPAGVLIVNVPPFNDQLRPRREVNPWEHLNYFSARHLRSMLASEGFSVHEVSVDIGLRPNLHGLRKWGNIGKSLLRLLSPPLSTCVMAKRP